MSMLTIMMVSTLTAGLLIAMAPTAAAENPATAGVYAGDGGFCTGSTRCVALRLVSDTATASHRTGWELNPGASVTLTYRTWTSGITPPNLPTGDHANDQCDLVVKHDNSNANVRVLHSADTCPADGTSYTFYSTSNGLVGGLARAGTYRIYVYVRDALSGTGGTVWEQNSDDATEGWKGALRGGTEITAISVNAYPAGSTFAYTVAGETMTWTATMTPANTNQVRKFNMVALDSTGNIPSGFSAVSVTAAADTGSFALSATVGDGWPAASALYGLRATVTDNSLLTGVDWTHFTAATTPVVLDSATQVHRPTFYTVDPRLTATHLVQLNDNVFGTGPMTKDKADGKRLTSDIAFRAVGFKNARDEGVNGLTASMSLADAGSLVSPVVDSGLTTATQGGEAGWTDLKAWTSALPGGSWTQTADITAPTSMDANTHLLTPTRTFTLLAPDPSVSVSVGAGDTSAPQDGWVPGRKLDIVAGMSKDATKLDFSAAYVSIIRFNPSTGQPEYLSSVSPAVWSTGSTFYKFGMGASPGDSKVALKQFTAAQTADWTFQDLNLIVQMVDAQGTPYPGTAALDVEAPKGADPVHVVASPDPVTPGETVLFTIQESFLNGKARTGNAAGTNIYLYDPSGTLIVNGANPTELQFGTYLFTYATTSASPAGSWYVIAKTTDSLTGDVNAASTTFYVRPDQGSYAPQFIAPSVAPVSTAASNTFKVFFTLYGPGGAMVDPTSNQVDITVTNQAGSAPTGVTLGGSPAGRMTRDAQGQYSLTVTVGTTATPDTRLAIKATYALLGTSRIAVAQTVIQDYSQKLSAIQTSLTTLQTDVTTIKTDTAALVTKWGTWSAATLAAEVDGLEEAIGTSADASSATTVFGRIKQLNELTTDDEADLTALIGTLQTTANTVSTNLNAFRTEVGATGQSETAYAKLLALQSALTTLQTDVTAIKNVGANQFVVPATVQVPASGTKTYVLQLNVANVAGLKDPDSSIVDIAVLNQAGSAPAGITLAGSPAGRMTRVAQGQYTLAVTVGTTAVPEDQLRWTATYLEGGVSRKIIGTSTLSDLDTQLNRMETALTTLQTDVTTIKGYTDTLETKWGSMDAATLAGYVDTVETVLGTSSDASSATTVFGRIKQLNELTTDDEADLTTLINGVQTTANTVSTNLNAFRTEVGATGQAQTAYALLQTIQTAIGTLQTDVTAIKNVGVNQFVVPATMQVPATSTKTYIIALNIGNVGGLKDPDSNIVDIAVLNQAGSAPAGVTMAGTPAGRMTRVAQGQYTLSITVGTSAIAEDQVRWTATYLEGGVSRKIIGTSTLMDLDTQLNRVETAITALQTDATAIKADTNALVAKWGSWTAATLAAEVDGLEEAVGTQADSSSTATLFGRIKQLNELTTDDEADLTALIGTLQTTANTLSTTLNSFRAEVGAQGQSLTAYQMLQAIQADLANVDGDVASLRTLVEYLDSYDILPGAVWHFRFNEATGTTFTSSIGNYVATMDGTTQVDRVSGPEGLAVFGGRYGDDDRAAVTVGSTAFLLGDFSLDAWVNREASATEDYAILMTENMANVPQQGISFTISNSGALKTYVTSASATQTVTWPSTSVQTGVWTHVAFSVDRQDTQIVIEAYINGVSLGAQASTVLYTAVSQVALLGDDGTDNEATTVGGLDDHRAYSRAISDSEANYLYASSSEVGRTTYLQNLGTNLGTVQSNVARLLSINVRDSGVVQAASSSGLTLASSASTTTSTYVGGVVYITSGTGVGQSRVITAYTSARVATLSRAWATTPAAGSEYVVFSSMDAPLVDSSLTVALRSVDRMFGHSGTAQAGTSTTITLASAASSVDDFYNGQAVKIYSSTGSDQVRVITDYVGATRVATVDQPWVVTPTSSSVYALILVPQLYLNGDLAVKVVREAVALVQADVDEVQTDTDALLAKWGTATAAEVLAEVDALEEAIGTSADTSSAATVFGRIKQLNELTTDDEADLTALVSTLQTTANTVSTNLNAFRTEVGAQGQGQTAYALLQSIQTALAAIGVDVDKILATGAAGLGAPTWLAVPPSGTRTYVLHFTMQSMDGLDDPDSNVVDIAVTNQAGSAPTGVTLGGTPVGRMTRSAAGQYTLTVTVGTTAVPEDELRWIATYLEAGATKKALAISTLQDYDIQLGRIEAAVAAVQTDVDLLQVDTAAILAKWGSFTASQLAGYVDTLETSVGSSADGAAVASLFGKIADLKATANSNDATTQAAIATLQTTANTVSTNLNAFRTEVGATGQSQTAYVLMQTIQAAVADLDSDLALARTAIQGGQDQTGALIGSWKFDEVPTVGGTNLVANPGFEATWTDNAQAPPSWTLHNRDVTDKDTTTIRSGAQSAKMTSDGAGSTPGIKQTLTGLVSGQAYHVEAWTSRTTGAETGRLYLYNSNDAAALIDTTTSAAAPTGWVKLSGTFTAVAGKTYVLHLLMTSASAGTVVYFDDVSVRTITVQDSGPGGFHGSPRAGTTLDGGPTPVWGRSGGGYLFDGVNDYIEIGDAEPLVPKSLTVEFWSYLNTNPGCDANNNWRTILYKGSPASTPTGFDVVLEESRAITFDIGTGTSTRAQTTVLVDLNVWNHFVLTYDAGSGAYAVYKNGGATTATGSMTAGGVAPNTSPLRIGGTPASAACPNGSGTFPGILDGVKLYNRALSNAEAKTAYDALHDTRNANPLMRMPEALLVPASGTRTYTVDLVLNSLLGLKDADSNIVDITVTNQAGAAPTGVTLGGSPAGRMTRSSQGIYTLQVTVASTAVINDQLRFTATYLEGGVSNKVIDTAYLNDLDVQLGRIETATTNLQTDVTAIKADTAAILAKWGSWTAASLAAEVDDIEERLGTSADASSANTVFGKLQSFRELHIADDASLDSQLGTITTTANTISTNLNAFRAEVGAQGQSQTAYAFMQGIQSALTTVGNDVIALKNDGEPTVSVPVAFEIPASGSRNYQVEFTLQALTGLKDPDSSVVDLSVTNQAGSAPTGITLAGTPAGRMTRTAAGLYGVQVTVASTATPTEQLRWTVSYTEATIAKKIRATTLLTDADTQLGRVETAAAAIQADVDLLQADTAAILAKWGSWTAASLAAEVDGLEESVGAQGDLSSAATLFGRIKQLKETADTNDASIDTQLANLQTTANTVSTNVNAFRAEVGAQGQAQTAYALVQSVQTSLAAVATDVTAIRTKGDPNLAVPVLMQIPASGSTVYRIEFTLGSVNGMKDPDSSIVDLAVSNQGGSAPTGITLAGTPAGRFTRASAGVYRVDVTVGTTAVANDQLRWVFTYTEGGIVKTIRANSVLMDLDTQLNRMEAAQTAIQADVDLLQVDTAAILAKWGSWTAATLAAEVDSIEESIGLASDATSAPTIYGRLNYLQNAAPAQQNDIDALQASVDALAATTASFRSEVGAQGQSQTAYALIQAVQTTLGVVNSDVAAIMGSGGPTLHSPAILQVPSSGSRTYVLDFTLNAVTGLKDPDSNIVDIAVTNQAGSAPTGITLAGTPAGRMTRTAAGQYTLTVTVASTAVANDQLRFVASWTEATIAKKARTAAALEDIDTQLNRMETALTALQTDVTAIKADTNALVAKWGTATAAQIIAEVDGLEEAIGASTDTSATNTVFGKIQSLRELQISDDASLDTQLAAINGLIGNVRSELGGQGKTITAYQLMLDIQTRTDKLLLGIDYERTVAANLVASWKLDEVSGTDGSNLVANHGFETYATSPGLPANWAQAGVVTGVTLTRDTTVKLDGANAVKVTVDWTTASLSQTQGVSQAVSGLQVGKSYYYEGWVYLHDALETNEIAQCKLRNNGANADIVTQSTPPIGAWTKCSGTFHVTSAPNYSIFLGLYRTAGNTGTTAVTFDSFTVQEIQAKDSAIGAYHGTLSAPTNTAGPVIGVAGKWGSTYDFDGVDDYVSITDNAALDFGTGSFTVSFWMQRDTTPASAYDALVAKKSHDGVVPGWMVSSASSSRLTFYLSDGTTQVTQTTSAGAVANGVWYHYAAVIDRSTQTVRIYLNGQLDATSASIAAVGSVDNAKMLAIGGDSDATATRFHDGRLDEVRVYGRALTAREVGIQYDQFQAFANIETMVLAVQADVDSLQADTAAILAKWGSWTAATLAAEVDGLEESVGAQGDLSSAATLFGRIKQLKETADTNDASLDSQLSAITTTANTISTNLNAFRAEVGAQGQSQTAYALMQSIQSALATVGNDVTAIKSLGAVNIAAPMAMQVPASGSQTYRLEFTMASTNGMKDPDSSIVDVSVVNQAGAAPTGVTRGGTPAGRLTRASAGVYSIDITVASTAVANDQLRWTFAYTEGGIARTVRATSILTDLDAQLNRMESAITAIQADVDLIQVDTASLLAKWGSWTAASLAAEVDGLEESIGAQADSSSTATLFGRIKQLKETADTNDASVDAQLAALQTTANAVSTTLDAFRAEVGATGQSETAYAKLLALQADLANLAADVTTVKNEITNPIYGLAAAFGITVRNAGTAQAGAASTITLATTASAVTDTYDGAVIYLTGGTGAGQTRVVTSYAGSTRVATVSRSWITNPDATTAYVVYATQDALATDSAQAVSVRSIDRVFGHSGTAQGATTTTITLTSGASAINDFYTGMPVKITSGTGIDQTRIITAYVGSTKVATVDRPWSTTPTSSSGYVILNNGELFIDGSIGLVNIEADVDTVLTQLTTLQTDVTAIKSDTTVLLAKWGTWNAATLAAEVDGLEESVGSATDASWQNTLFGKIKDLNELAVANDASIDTQLVAIQTTATAVNTLLTDLHTEVGAHGKSRTAYKLLEDLEAALTDLNGDVAAAQVAILADSAARWGQWRTLFEIYWADYNATEQANLLALLDRIEDLEAANQGRFIDTMAELEAMWLALVAEVNQNENRLITFEDRLNATLAAHMAALLVFEESIQDTLAEERSIMEGLWADLNNTQAAAGADRQAKLDAIMASILAQSGELQASLDVHHTQTMENLTDLQDFTTQAFEDHDAYMVAQFTSTQDSLRENFTALGGLFGEHEETRGVLAGFWTDHNQTWAAWNTYYAGSQGNASADIQALVIAEANVTRNLDSFNHETYFNKYGSVVQEYSGYVVGGLGEEILKVQDKLDENEEQNFWQLGWISLVVDFIKWGFLALIVIMLGLFGVSSRIRRVVRNTTPVAGLIEGRRRRAEAKAARAAERAAREKPRNQGREDRPRGVGVQEGPGPARMAPRNWRP